MLTFYIIPYPIYRTIAHRYGWETNAKTMTRHWSDLFNGLTYGLILFVFGNYTHTFNWVTLVAFYPSLIAYALIAELPFTRTSLPNIKSWPKGMWVVFIIAVATKLAQWKRKKVGSDDEATSLLQPDNVAVVSPYSRNVAIHLHHWQIFYVLAFFTRFDDVVSQVGAGIVLACYMEGICAYGYDSLVNDS
ncbi:hypothetical protein BDF21DRAFT_399658 [Thamnidium elegans]|nr:hypothetical protein BDF21DRAFT_399658 [Thamnidium elegans]